MREVELNHININGIEYPLHCDLFALEVLQNEFQSVNKFERDLLGLTPLRDENGEVKRNDEGVILNAQGEPKIGAIIRGLYVMIKEGQRINGRQTGKEYEEITYEEIGENCFIPFTKLADILHDEFNHSFSVKKKSSTKRPRKKSIS